MSESKFLIRGIPSAMIERFWPFAEPYIKRALDRSHGEWLAEDIKKSCQEKDMQLWLITEGNKVIAAVTSEIVLYPRRKHCRIVTMAGSRASEWLNDAATIVFSWAKEQGCVGLEGCVRKGFVPMLVKNGYKYTHSTVYKDI